MITEDYVSFETAKLLKEKGFDEYCDKLWALDRVSYTHLFAVPVFVDGYFKAKTENIEAAKKWFKETYNELYTEVYLAPTLQMAMKWLREVHNIAISVYVFNRYLPIEANDIIYTCDIATTSTAPNDGFLRLSGPYEEVCESAIKHCLEKLI